MDSRQNLSASIEPKRPATDQKSMNKTTNSNNDIDKKYIFYDQMDDANKKAMDVLQTKGMSAAIEHMFKDPESGRQLTYGEMRARYG